MRPAAVSAVEPGLLIVTVSVLVPPTATACGLNALVTAGPTTTVTSSAVEDVAT